MRTVPVLLQGRPRARLRENCAAGICYYIEQCGGGGGTEFSEVSIGGWQNRADHWHTEQWTGHETAFAQVLCDKLYVDFDDIESIRVIHQPWPRAMAPVVTLPVNGWPCRTGRGRQHDRARLHMLRTTRGRETISLSATANSPLSAPTAPLA